jgi:hypothetical protein
VIRPGRAWRASSAPGLGVSLVLAAACLATLACAGGARKPSAPATEPSAEEMSEAAPEDPHIEIEERDRDITAALARAGIAPPVATCSGATCATAISEPLSTPTSGPSCRPTSPGDRCSDLCTLAASICRNQERICTLAQHLLYDDWAANKCTRARASCQAAHDVCCGCLQRRRQPPFSLP